MEHIVMDDRNMDENHSIGDNSYKIVKIYNAQSLFTRNDKQCKSIATEHNMGLGSAIPGNEGHELVKNIYRCKYNGSKNPPYMACMMCLFGPPMNLFDSKYNFALLYPAPC
jgi:hypothetical protein